MIKERKKALAEKTTLVLIECDFNASKELAVVTKLIDIVAAEAREKGIEEFYAYLIKIHPASLEQIANLMNELLEKKNV